MSESSGRVLGKRVRSGRWSGAEIELFEQLVEQYGKNWKKIQGFIRGRTLAQIRSHGQKFFDRVGPQKAQEYERKAKLLQAIEVLKLEKMWARHGGDREPEERDRIKVEPEQQDGEEREEATDLPEMKNEAPQALPDVKGLLSPGSEAKSSSLPLNSLQHPENRTLHGHASLFRPFFWYHSLPPFPHGAQTFNYYPGSYGANR